MDAGASRAAAVGVCVALLVGCSGPTPDPAATSPPRTSPQSASSDAPTPDPLAGSTRLRFRTTDGVRLDGRLFGRGSVGVVLAHQVDNDQSAWFPFAHVLAIHGYRALTFDYRGYCPGGSAGCSTGSPDVEASGDDVDAAVGALRATGVRDVFLIGASVGGQAVIVSASGSAEPPSGIVSLSAPEFFAYELTRRILASTHAPSLFIAGRTDGDAASSARDFYRWSGEPRDLLVLDSGAHGTALLSPETPVIADRVRGRILAFLSRYANR